jgi:hypothetical protein
MTDTCKAMEISLAACLTIAKINFELHSQDLPVQWENNQAYRQFITFEKEDSANIPVTILIEDTMPLLKPLSKTFDTDQAWAMYSDGKNRYIAQHHLDRSKGPRYLAKIKPGFKGVTVYCSKDTVKQHQGKDILINPVSYPLDQILLTNFLVGKALLIHATGIIIEDKGYLFAGVSGAGKSTLSRMLLKNKNISTLSDDRIIIRNDEAGFFMYGTPWPGDAGIAVNNSARLHGIFFLNQSANNKINELIPQEALQYLFKVGSIPWYDKSELNKSLDFCDELLLEVKNYELNFRPGPEIVENILSFVSG